MKAFSLMRIQMIKDFQKSVRLATIQDLKAIYEFDRLCFPIDAFSKNQWAHLLKSTSASTWIIEAENSKMILGVITALMRRGIQTARLYSFAIHPDARKQALATQLHAYVMDLFKNQSIKKVHLEVRENNLPALHFYHRLGYLPIAKLPNYYPDGIDGIKMALHIART